MTKIVRMTINVILILAILFLVVYLALRMTGKIKIYNVETGSMEDKIHAGDYILLCRKDNYQIGDIVTYTVDNYFVTHRIIKIEDDSITTKGDANNTEDKKINKNQIVGKMIYSGGLLNIIINYKYAIIAFLIGLYLLSCYIGSEEK